MTVNLPFLLLAIALLWFPRQWLRLGFAVKRRRSSSARRTSEEPWNNREPGDPRVNFGGEFSKFRNYVDLLRAAVGSLAFSGVMGLTPSLGVAENVLAGAEGAPRNTTYIVLLIRLAILGIGLLVQTVRYEKQHLTLYPAIFYIAGLTVGLCDPWPAAFAFVLIWATHMLFGGAQSFLTGYAVVVAAFGYFFARQGLLPVIAAAGFCFFPVLLSLMANRPLVVFSRKGTHSDR
jgi:hypothetical protein